MCFFQYLVSFNAFCKAALTAAWFRCQKGRVLVSTLSLSYSFFSGIKVSRKDSVCGSCSGCQDSAPSSSSGSPETELLLRVHSTLWRAGIFTCLCFSHRCVVRWELLSNGVQEGLVCPSPGSSAAFLLCPHGLLHFHWWELFWLAKRVSWQPPKLILQGCVNHPRP